MPSKGRGARAQNNAKTTRGKPFEKGNTLGFKKGQSGNPGGRPRRDHDWLKDQLQALFEESIKLPDGSKMPRLDALARALASKPQVFIAMLDHAYGKPSQQFEHTGAGGGAIEVKDVNASRDEIIAELQRRGITVSVSKPASDA